MRRLGLILLLLACGCTLQPKTATLVAGRPAPAPDFELPIAASPAAVARVPQPGVGEVSDPQSQRAMVIVDRPQDAGRYTVSLVALDGTLLASRAARQPEPFAVHYETCPGETGPCDRMVSVPAPLTSTSMAHVYYLDGGQVVALERDGVTHVVARVPSGPRLVSAFSVSGFEQRIAVSVLDYSRYPAQVSMKLYVEDLYTGGHHVDLFDSNTVVEWPVSWLWNRLVVAVGDPVAGNGYSNPAHTRYGYHVVDSASGLRTVTMSDRCIYGPLSMAGTACRLDGTPAVQTWDGRMLSVGEPGLALGDSILASPSAIRVAAVEGGGDRIIVGGRLPDAFSSPSGTPVGWLDDEHLFFKSFESGKLSVLHVHNGSVTSVPSTGELVGSIGFPHG